MIYDKLSSRQELIGTLEGWHKQGSTVIIHLSMPRVLKIPADQDLIEKLKKAQGKTIGILNLEGKYYIDDGEELI